MTEQRRAGVNRLLDNTLVPYTEKCVDNRALQQCILGGAVMEAGSRGRLLDLFDLKRREAKNVKCL